MGIQGHDISGKERKNDQKRKGSRGEEVNVLRDA